jgi:hypothetical protein
MTSSFECEALHRRLLHERDRVRRDLLHEIKRLRDNLRSAEQRLGEGRTVDAHLIANAATMTESIARWNMTVDLLPFLEAKS